MSVKDRFVAFGLRHRHNRALRFAYRAQIIATTKSALRGGPRQSLRFLFRGRETSNFTYENANINELAAFVAQALQVELETVQGYLAELDTDHELLEMLRAKLKDNPSREAEPRFGYRRINYCATRIWKPSVVAEAGTHDGLQASVVLRALQRNAAEGSPGRLFGFDSTPEAGWLVDDSLRENLTVVVGDINETLAPVLETHGVEYMIDDIGSSFEHKSEILRTAIRCSRGRLVLMTELDGNPALRGLCDQSGGRYSTFVEDPLDHFWPGHEWGLGVFPELSA